MTKHSIQLLLLGLFACCGTSAVAEVDITFTPFNQRQMNSRSMQDQWGEVWEWPLKTFPNSLDLGGAYGLVYWPGEKIIVNVYGDPDRTVSRLTCTNALDEGDALACTKVGDSVWQVAIDGNQKAPCLEVYRMRAFAGAEEVASRGLIVTSPWSGAKNSQDPKFSNCSTIMMEWGAGNNPFDNMVYIGASPRRSSSWGEAQPEFWPMKNRPFGWIDKYGLSDILYPVRWGHDYWPRLGKNGHADDFSQLNSQALNDPYLEWGFWWTYFANGCAKWHGELPWGPFSSMAVEAIDPAENSQGGPLRQYQAPLPNGLLFWQWNYYGLYQMSGQFMANHWLKDARATNSAADGWQESLGNGGHTTEVGSLPLYYKRCQYYENDLSWASRYNSMAEFFRQGKTKDYNWDYATMELSRMGYWVYDHSAYEAYKEYKGVPVCQYKFNAGFNQAWIDNSMILGLRRDQSEFAKQWYAAGFGNNAGGLTFSGTDDYSHDGSFMGLWGAAGRSLEAQVGSKTYYNATRGYRGDGYYGGINSVISDTRDFPSFYAGGGHCFEGLMPGLRPDPDQRLPLNHNNPIYYQYLNNYLRDDGTSFRRLDMFTRVPMVYHINGTLTGYQRTFLYGSGDMNDLQTQSGVPDNDLWNTQYVLGAQVMEIPDRRRPVGGVLVLDSPNTDDIEAGKDFLTSGPFKDYIAAVHDALGIVTYARPEAVPTIPEDIPRIYMLRHDGVGNDTPYMIAEFPNTGAKIKVAYDGYVPSHYWEEGFPGLPTPAFKDFVSRVKAAYPGGWPISTTGGFIATAWESSKGVWVYVENPIEAKGVIHTARTGSVTVKARGLRRKPIVIDMCGNLPDPHLLPEDQVSVDGEFVTFTLDWPKGDARLFYIDHTVP